MHQRAHHLSSSAATCPSSSSSSSSASPSPSPSKAFSTSSSDFALPFGARPVAASTSASNVPGASSSTIPISIPRSPSLLAQSSTRQPPPTGLHISDSKFNPKHASPHAVAATAGSSHAAGLGIANLISPSAKEHLNPFASHSLAAGQQPRSPTQMTGADSWLQAHASGSSSSSSSSSAPGIVGTTGVMLRRGPGMTSPGFAVASPARFRRASMLGREITPFQLDQDGSEEEGIGAHDQSNNDADDGDDEMMQMDEDGGIPSGAPSTPAMGPPASLHNAPTTPPPQLSGFGQLASFGSMRRGAASSALTRMTTSDSGQDSSSSAGERSGVQSFAATKPSSGSPSLAQGTGSPLSGGRSRSSSLLSGNVVRTAVTRRGNLLPRDRSILRVAASLQDEDRPEDSEIASEAKLQKRIGGDPTLPPTPRTVGERHASASKMSKSPFLASTGHAGLSKKKYMWDDNLDDIQGVFAADGLDDEDSSEISSEEEEMMMYYSRTGSVSEEEDASRNNRPAAGDDDNMMMEDPPSPQAHAHARAIEAGSGTASEVESGAVSSGNGTGSGNGGQALTSLGTSSGSFPKRKGSLWTGFRDKSNAHKWSPGMAAASGFSERAMLRRSGGGGAGAAGASANVGSAAAIIMEMETSPRIFAANVNARLSKRKMMGEDRYEPYKRRAVSPMSLGAALGSNAIVGSPSQPAIANTSGSMNPSSNANLSGGLKSPSFAPSSSPSSSFAGGGNGLLYRNSPSSVAASATAHHHPYHHHHHHARYSTSPTISRPCTPTPMHSTHPTPAFGPSGGSSFSPAAAAAIGSGSGPGYGSGALGLSISANPTLASPTLKALEQEENEAMDQRVGMLGLS